MSDFLIDASLPRAAGNVIRAHGHQATDVRDIGLGRHIQPEAKIKGRGARHFIKANPHAPRDANLNLGRRAAAKD